MNHSNTLNTHYKNSQWTRTECFINWLTILMSYSKFGVLQTISYMMLRTSLVYGLLPIFISYSMLEHFINESLVGWPKEVLTVFTSCILNPSTISLSNYIEIRTIYLFHSLLRYSYLKCSTCVYSLIVCVDT